MASNLLQSNEKQRIAEVEFFAVHDWHFSEFLSITTDK